MRRPGALGAVSGLTDVRRGLVLASAGPPVVVRAAGQFGAPSNWADGSATGLLTDNAPGDNSTAVQLSGSANPYVTGMYDLGAPVVVTRVRKRHGNIGGNGWPHPVEASHDGTVWVNAYTGAALPVELSGFNFTWRPEYDLSEITTTAYRYWRVVSHDAEVALGEGTTALGDFRLYVGGVLVV